MKNIDKIRQMSTWELAEFLHDVSVHATKFTVCERDCEKCDFSHSACTSEIAEWLFEEANDEYREMLKKIQEVCRKNDDCNECPINDLCSFSPFRWTESDIDRYAEALADG